MLEDPENVERWDDRLSILDNRNGESHDQPPRCSASPPVPASPSARGLRHPIRAPCKSAAVKISHRHLPPLPFASPLFNPVPRTSTIISTPSLIPLPCASAALRALNCAIDSEGVKSERVLSCESATTAAGSSGVEVEAELLERGVDCSKRVEGDGAKERVSEKDDVAEDDARAGVVWNELWGEVKESAEEADKFGRRGSGEWRKGFFRFSLLAEGCETTSLLEWYRRGELGGTRGDDVGTAGPDLEAEAGALNLNPASDCFAPTEGRVSLPGQERWTHKGWARRLRQDDEWAGGRCLGREKDPLCEGER